MERPRLLVWSVTETAGFDAAWVRLGSDRLTADGEATGQLPGPYSLRYHLETGDEWATRRLEVEATTDAGARTLDLRRTQTGWTVNGETRPDLADALDCDLAACPLTNTMPIRRFDLHRASGDRTFLMAFVEVPTLEVVASRQRYTTVRPLAPRSAGTAGTAGTADTSAIVTYRSDGFESDLEIDADGLVVVYPGLGRRIAPVSAARGG
ncbi:MAG TPA: putative glycolipid-binding domain-containing protein [Candidatus Limnocylindrales bacterium]|nr:putative glycolipid-binding domain-containing protein [Candidatus Limnocylindrales bacterium]